VAAAVERSGASKQKTPEAFFYAFGVCRMVPLPAYVEGEYRWTVSDTVTVAKLEGSRSPVRSLNDAKSSF
jgi:hypothetical protein